MQRSLPRKTQSWKNWNKIKDQQANKHVEIQATEQEFQTFTVEIHRWDI